MFFAAAENQRRLRVLINCKVQNALISYFYINKGKLNTGELLSSFPNVCMDSGAFTVITAEKKNWTKKEHQKYMEQYLDLLWDNVGKFFWVANYDVEAILGTKIVDEWNLEFEKLQEAGQQVCFVPHDLDQRKFDRTLDYLQRYDYVGAKAYNSRYTYFEARKRKKRVHGFAMTGFNTQKNYPMFSTDSSTYIGAERYGCTYVWNGAYFESWDKSVKHRRNTLKKWCDLWEIDFDLLLQDDMDTTLEFSIRSWMFNEAYYNRLTRNKQWWLSNEERKSYNINLNGKGIAKNFRQK